MVLRHAYHLFAGRAAREIPDILPPESPRLHSGWIPLGHLLWAASLARFHGRLAGVRDYGHRGRLPHLSPLPGFTDLLCLNLSETSRADHTNSFRENRAAVSCHP